MTVKESTKAGTTDASGTAEKPESDKPAEVVNTTPVGNVPPSAPALPGQVNIGKLSDSEFFTLLGVVGPVVANSDKALLTGILGKMRDAYDAYQRPVDPAAEAPVLSDQKTAQDQMDRGNSLYVLGGQVIESLRSHPLFADFVPVCLGKMGLTSLEQWESARSEYLEAESHLATANRTLAELRRANREASKAVFAKTSKTSKPGTEGKTVLAEGWYTSRGSFLYVNSDKSTRLVDTTQGYVSPAFKATSLQSVNVAASLWKKGGLEKWIESGASNAGQNHGSAPERVTKCETLPKDAAILLGKEIAPA